MIPPRRGEVYLVDFDPARGHEMRKTRPAVIIQNDSGNRNSPVTIVAAITSTILPHRVMVPVQPTKENGLLVPSVVHLAQLRSVDRERLLRLLGTLDAATMREVDEALRVSLALMDL